MTSNQKYLVKVVKGNNKGKFFKRPDEGVTSDRNKAHAYTAREVQAVLRFLTPKAHTILPIVPFNQ